MQKQREEEAEPTFESALQELEASIRAMEQGQLGLDGTLQAYEKAIGQLRFCSQQLEQAERRIELLQAVDARGIPQTEPFAEGGEDLEEKQAHRARRRSV